MLIKKGPLDGAQPRSHVLAVLKKFGVSVAVDSDDFFVLVDKEDDIEVLLIPDPVLSETVVHLFRRFGKLHGFEITDLVRKH